MNYNNRTKKYINIWIEQLTALDSIIFIVKSLFEDIVVKYDENKVSPMAKLLIFFLNSLSLSKKFYPARLTLGKKDTNGYALNYKMQENLDICLERYCKQYFPKETVRFKKMVKSYIAQYLFYRITFITMVESEPDFQKNPCQNILYLSASPFNSIIVDFYKQKGYCLARAFISWNNIRNYLLPYYYLSVILLSRLNFRKIRTNITKIKPSVWIEYAYTHTFIDVSFWNKALKKKEFDIVYYVDRRDDPPIETVAEEIEKRELKWIDLHFFCLVKLANLKVSHMKDLVKELIFYPFLRPAWLRIFKFKYKMWFYFYKEVFSFFKVKVIIQHQELSWIQEAQLSAIESIGGAMLGFHWSIYQFSLEPFHLTPQHVYFVWGKTIFEWAEEKGNSCRYILPSGIWFGQERNTDGRLVNFSKGQGFIIAIFDSNATYNLFNSPNTLSKFYLRILKLLESNPHWGGVIKSKTSEFVNSISLLPNGEKILNTMKLLIDNNRLLVLDSKTSPVTAAAHAHIGVCYGINSAGIISGIYGYRAIHWDCCGWLRHEFYKDANQKITYLDLDEFERAIIKVSNGDNEIGDFSKWRQRFNYFNDFDASNRVGRFIHSFMEKSTRSNDLEYLLSSTVDEYILENRVEMIF